MDLEVATTKGQAVKESTKKNLLTYLNSYQQFCNKYQLPYFPTDNIQLCRFGQHLARTFQSSDAVGNYQCDIRTCQALLGFEVHNPKKNRCNFLHNSSEGSYYMKSSKLNPSPPKLLLRLSAVILIT